MMSQFNFLVAALLLLPALCVGNASGPENVPVDPRPVFMDFLEEYLEVTYTSRSFNEYVYVSLKNQRLYYVCNGAVQQQYDISSGRRGVGNYKGSGGTPIGLHSVYRKIGDKVPEGGIFWHTRYTGRVLDSTYTKNNAITSRIIWLTGEEWGLNKGGIHDTSERFIYIHGTSGEDSIGKPASRGCIRMRNADVVELYPMLEVGTAIIIADN